MKSYTPEKLVAVSRYRKFFPTLPEERLAVERSYTLPFQYHNGEATISKEFLKAIDSSIGL